MTDEMIERCPFCGTRGELMEGHRNHWRVECPKCGVRRAQFANGGDEKDKARAIRSWNTRAFASSDRADLVRRCEELEHERSFIWKWIERAIFDKQLSTDECLSTLAGYPGAPWMNGRWDVDHKPYATEFYKRFPRAALKEQGHG